MATQRLALKYRGRARLMIRDLIDSLQSLQLYDSTHPWKGILTDLGIQATLPTMLAAAQAALVMKTSRN